MLGMPRVDSIGSLLAARRGKGGPIIVDWTGALAEWTTNLSGMTIFAAKLWTMGAEFDTSINVGFRNTGPLPLGNSGSSRYELICCFQATGVTLVQVVISSTKETVTRLGALATLTP